MAHQISQLSVDTKNTCGEQDRLGCAVKDQKFCKTLGKLLIIYYAIITTSDNYHKAALWKCKLLTVTSWNRFGDRARKPSSIDPELWVWALFLALFTLPSLYLQPGDLDYLSVRQVHVLLSYYWLQKLLKAQPVIPVCHLISWLLLISPTFSVIL